MHSKLKKYAAFVSVLTALACLTSCGRAENSLDNGSDIFSSSAFCTEDAIGGESIPTDIPPLEQGEQAQGEEQMRRAVWISYLDLQNLDMSSEDALRADVRKVMENLKTIECTDIFLQVRAFGEALYRSDIFPSAEFIYSDLADGLDVLDIFLKAAHDSGMRLHAWINPYRLSSDESVRPLREQLTAADPYSVWEDETGVYIVPSSRQGRELVERGIDELISRYPVDGIHFDDYFYPTTSEEIDSELYADYCEEGGNMSLDDYRRFNVSELIGDVYKAVKGLERPVEFGVSPDASVSRDRTVHYADVSLWGAQGGYIDYLCPQIYYGFENESMPFEAVVSEWKGVCMQCELWVGLAFYKVGEHDEWAGTGEGEWQSGFDIIARQYGLLQSEGVRAAALYRYDSMFGDAAVDSAAASAELDNLVKAVG